MADLPLPTDRAQQTQWVEAMLSGSSVIAAPLPGNREALGDAVQYAPRDDVDEWVAALCRLENRGVYAAAAARARAHTAGLDYAADLGQVQAHAPARRRARTVLCGPGSSPGRAGARTRAAAGTPRVAWVHYGVPYRRAGSETMLHTMRRTLHDGETPVLVVCSDMPEDPTW
ncbi:glycosyltransferase [Streptomyces hygroscopicus]|uniref:glycosyltransferase n=1 Tax=Streptomyces hygroscopicus TaxID=1912 RepID=UPI0033CCA259